MINAIAFDLDGLIVDTEKTALRSWQELYDAHGVELPLDMWRTTIGTWEAPFDPASHLSAARGSALTEDELRARLERKWELAAQLPVLPGVREHIEAARERGAGTAVVSSSSRDWVNAQIERLGLAEHFDCVCTREDVPHTKPDPGLYYRALLLLGVDAASTLAYEDSAHGLVAAKAAGLRCVVVPTELTAESDFSRADVVLASLADVDPHTLWDFIDADYE